jgi:hypothetical protein
VKYFPAREFSSYRDFIKIAGNTLKQEPRTRVILVHRLADNDAVAEPCAFIVKCHRYPFLPRLRTVFRISKAENEFKSLLHLKNLRVAAVEPVGFGAERTRLGFVRSCFVITRYLHETTDLADWHWTNHDKEDSTRKAARLRQLGATFRRLHSARFFLFSVKPRNILLRLGDHNEATFHFVDTPYARTLRWRPLVRWAQGRDLGYCLGSFHPNVTSEDLESFFEGYLPDTLGGTTKSVQRRVARAIRAQQNMTPLSRLVNAVKLYARQKRLLRRARRALSR